MKVITSNHEKIAVFDMDNTLLQRSFIYMAAEEFGFTGKLLEIVRSQQNPFMRTSQIAQLLKGRSREELKRLVTSIPVTPNTRYLVYLLKENVFITVIISDIYYFVTQCL